MLKAFLSNNKRKITLWIAGILVVLIALGLYLGFRQTNQIRWNMHASVVDADGRVQQTMELTVKGSAPKDGKMKLEMQFAKDFPHRVISDTFYDEFRNIDSIPYFCGSGFTVVEDADPISEMSFALDMEAGYLLVYFQDIPGYLVVASRDGNATPEQILAHFEDFLQIKKIPQ